MEGEAEVVDSVINVDDLMLAAIHCADSSVTVAISNL